MNKTFKVVYNRARAGLMVANEITSSVQKRGTKTVVAVGVAMLMVSGAVLAQDIEYSQTSENKGYKLISEGSQEFSADDVLKMTIMPDTLTKELLRLISAKKQIGIILPTPGVSRA